MSKILRNILSYLKCYKGCLNICSKEDKFIKLINSAYNISSHMSSILVLDDFHRRSEIQFIGKSGFNGTNY